MLGVQLAVKSVKIPDSPYTVELFVYDCAGQETFTPYVSKVLGSSALVMLVFDVSNETSLSAAVKWFERVKNANKDFKVHICIRVTVYRGPVNRGFTVLVKSF